MAHSYMTLFLSSLDLKIVSSNPDPTEKIGRGNPIFVTKS